MELENVLIKSIEDIKDIDFVLLSNKFEIIANEIKNNSNGIVIYGASGTGKRIYKYLRNKGLKVFAFSDRNERLWGNNIDGISILPIKDICRIYGFNINIIICVSSFDVQSIYNYVQGFGFNKIYSIPHLIYVIPELFPYTFLNSFLFNLINSSIVSPI